MNDTTRSVIVPLLLTVLREAFEGPPGPWTYFSDSGPGSGVLGTIGGLSAADASRPGGPGGTTIAGHVHHVCASLALTTRELRGETTSRDRSRSWTVLEVDEGAWTALQAELRSEYGRVVAAVVARAVWDEDALGAAVGAVAHAAYHLGAIRQRLGAGRAGAA